MRAFESDCGGFVDFDQPQVRSKLFTGDLFLLYLVLYPTIRFFLEFLRLILRR